MKGGLVRTRDLETKPGRAALRRSLRQIRAVPGDIHDVIAVARAAVRHGRDQFAADVLADAAGRVREAGADSAPALARLDAAAAVLALGRGDTPDGWPALVRATLRAADAAPPAWAADLVADACDVAFHRTIQLDSATTPLARDPDGFLHPFRSSCTITRARAGFRSPGPYSHRFSAYDCVVMSEGNLNFIDGVAGRLAAAGRTVQYVNLAALRDDFPATPHDLIATVVRGEAQAWAPAVGVLAGNARLVWAEWAHRQALIPSHALPAGPRFVVRLHAVEVFTAMPQFVHWDRVDALVVVSPVMANAVNAILPVPPSVPVHVVPNHIDPAPFDRPKRPGARHTMALVGHNSQVKDPAWALDVLDLVRRSEPRARLLLVGEQMTPTHRAQGPAAAGYATSYLARLDRYVADGSVTVLGRTRDVGEALRSAGFVLSTSRRESFHLGLLEGALSGCVAACRDWPVMAPFGGAATFLPDRWVVADPAAMAQRVLAYMADENAWTGEGRRCRDEALRIVRPARSDPLSALLALG